MSNKDSIPNELREIGALIRTQNNRGTDQPMFVVQQKREYVTDEHYNESRVEWRRDGDRDYEAITGLRASRLESLRKDGRDTPGYERLALMHVWEHVTSCFTEQGCKDYIQENRHNHSSELRIYAEGSFRNYEFQAIRNWLMSLNPANDLP